MLKYYRRVTAFNRHCGVDGREITKEEVRDRGPFVVTSDVLAGYYVATDRRANPTDATMALVKGARMSGIMVVAQESGVITSSGEMIRVNALTNCAGNWARQLGERCGVRVPNQAAEHYYVIL
jgi:glycine/D-amino acid oxidase-like deaminating enzyme